MLPLQLLFLNLLVDVFPALALGVSRGMPNVMKLPPKGPEESILTKQSWMMISPHGAILAIWVIGVYFTGLFYLDVSKEIANNIAFFGLAFMQLLHVLDMRDLDEPFFKNQVTRNNYVWCALAFCAVVILAAYFIPGLNTMLSFQPMGTLPWILVVATMFLSVGSIQLLKKLKVIQ